jgi:ornithine cyclodeaminase
MPASSRESLSLKVVAIRPENAKLGLPTIPATMLVVDAQTGLLRAILDATDLTTLRTAAGSALATKLLAREDVTKLAIFGAGRQAEAHVDAMLHVRPGIQTVHIWNRTIARAQELVDRLVARYPNNNVSFSAVDDAAMALRGALVVCTCTNSSVPLFDGRLVENGAHLNLVGAYKPEMREVDSALVARVDTIVVDSTESARTEAGDLLIPLREGLIGVEKLELDLGTVMKQHRQRSVGARRSTGEEELTLFKSCGHALQDLYAAKHVIATAESSHLGTYVDM